MVEASVAYCDFLQLLYKLLLANSSKWFEYIIIESVAAYCIKREKKRETKSEATALIGLFKSRLQF